MPLPPAPLIWGATRGWLSGELFPGDFCGLLSLSGVKERELEWGERDGDSESDRLVERMEGGLAERLRGLEVDRAKETERERERDRDGEREGEGEATGERRELGETERRERREKEGEAEREEKGGLGGLVALNFVSLADTRCHSLVVHAVSA